MSRLSHVASTKINLKLHTKERLPFKIAATCLPYYSGQLQVCIHYNINVIAEVSPSTLAMSYHYIIDNEILDHLHIQNANCAFMNTVISGTFNTYSLNLN